MAICACATADSVWVMLLAHAWLATCLSWGLCLHASDLQCQLQPSDLHVIGQVVLGRMIAPENKIFRSKIHNICCYGMKGAHCVPRSKVPWVCSWEPLSVMHCDSWLPCHKRQKLIRLVCWSGKLSNWTWISNLMMLTSIASFMYCGQAEHLLVEFYELL